MLCENRDGNNRVLQHHDGCQTGVHFTPFLFLMVVDFVMRKATVEDGTGVKWVNGSELNDLDFADDIALLAKDENGLQQLTSNLEIAACRFGLRISTENTKVMYVGARNITPINVGTEPIEEVTRFTYLGSLITKNGDAEMDVKSRVEVPTPNNEDLIQRPYHQ
ncbi:uncharacterized protein LOC112041786 [Lingula anatina]|uniref:Uncharacterized protein LOC112041786 n=1 Tax=Lingula anatina TaxID=7574 RepID=A0A2R2MMB3_LINAN|nr:uncharacterized protein LOC112041786 [Lingula anatina]|eukprot:XP_023931192.1 uncharacterized protein LOC112041786 [Lingula anatina]